MLGETIRRAREGFGFSIRELGRRTGVSAAQLSRIEAGQVEQPSIDTLVAVARGLDRNPKPLLIVSGHIGRDEALLNPSELFRKSEAQGEIDSEDAAYWNVELNEPEGEPLAAESDTSFMQVELQPALDDDPLIQEAIRLGCVVAEIGTEYPERQAAAVTTSEHEPQPFAQIVSDYLDSVHIITNDQKLSMLRTELLTLLQASPAHLRDWLRDNRVVFPGCETEVAAQIMRLAKQISNSSSATVVDLHPVKVSPKPRKPAAAKTRRLDLMAVPDDAPQPKRQQPERVAETAPLQLALF